MGHDLRDRLTEYWSNMEQFYTPCYSNTLKRDRILHTQRFILFEDLSKETDKNDENHDRLWKTRDISEMLRTGYESYYNPFELVATDEVIVLF
jgi:hypothetical protein